MSYDEDSPGATCPWPHTCRCTHVGCVDGWIDRTRPDQPRPDGTPTVKHYVQACPNCRPEVARHLSDRSKPLGRLRRELPALPRPSRTPAPTRSRGPRQEDLEF